MSQLYPILVVILIAVAIAIPIIVFAISDAQGHVFTFKARPINDSSYLSRYYQVKYRSLNGIYRYLEDLTKSHSFFCQLSTIGYTTKKGPLPQNPIHLLKISSGFAKPIILIIGGVYANDWKSTTSILYIANQLLANCSKVGGLITAYDWYFVPILNPDGYNYSHTTPAAMNWIKNIARWSMDYEGVNLDYNFAYHFKKDYNFHQDTYPGIKPFSEAESQALKNLVVDIHQYIEMVFIFKSPFRTPVDPTISFPWSYSTKRPNNWVLMEYLGLAGARAAKSATGTDYDVIQSGRHASNQSGRIDDWLFGIAGIRKVLTVHGHFVADLIFDPYESILEMGTEMFAIVKAVSEAAFNQPNSYRRTRKRISIDHIVTIRTPSTPSSPKTPSPLRFT